MTDIKPERQDIKFGEVTIAGMLPLRDNVPTRRFPAVTVAIIAANFTVWFWELGATEAQVDRYAFYPCDLSGPCLAAAHLAWWESAFTSMFLHASWAHILGNMLFLWIFGNNVEDALGPRRYALFYVGGGLAATAGQTFVTLHYGGTPAASIPNLGASGAIAAVLGAYLVLLPSASVLTIVGFILVPIPAFLFLGVWFGFQLWEGGFSVTHPSSGGGIAFFAHVFGFVYGAVVVRLLAVRPPVRPSW
jgi:membrane associated rhomboid family serine protease